MASTAAPFTLYSSDYSVRSIMIQLLYEIRGVPRSGLPDIALHREMIDVAPPKFEQLSEAFLVKINSAVMVPVLVNDDSKYLSDPMPETIKITEYLCEWFPSLLPSGHKAAIVELLHELLDIDYPVLTLGVPNPVLPMQEQAIREKLAGNISNEYKSALEYKLDSHPSMRDPTDDDLREMERRTIDALTKVVALRERHKTETALDDERFSYIFGQEPTALDMITVAFVGRMHDKKRTDLLPSALVGWYLRFREEGIWKRAVPTGYTLPEFMR